MLTPGLGLVVVMMSMVIYRAVAQSFGLYNFGGEDILSLAHWQEMFDNRRYWSALRWSGYIATTSALLSVALAYPLALWLRRPFFGSTILSAMIKAPYFVPGLVAAFLLINVISFHGFVNEFMIWIGLWDKPVRMQNDENGYAIIGLQVWKQLPLAFLLLLGSIQSIPDSVLHAAQDLGAGTLARFRRVVLPLTMKAMQAALVLIFIGAAGDFSFQAIAGPARKNSMATLMTQLQGSNYSDWNGAAVVGVTLMGLSLVGAVALAGFVQLMTKFTENVR
ncbi:ABC transporter permease [Primorskyibacter aestuariivivens]|uniref:ABC transporter permease n=1 Tax=Primorskyibacter aestuariivivens TaxID=1888912 RepID=UPI0023007D28|nr:ABC transporter permease [Primorskyibacter aestuariivivens]MDA7430636.1 ABC transporter permease [Primorskyibacter aestuariivivens]